MIGWTVKAISRSGWRGIRSRLRLSDAPACRTTQPQPHPPPRSASSLLGRVAGEREEHVVERRPAQRDVVDADAGVVERAARPRRSRRARRDRDAHDAVLDVGALVGTSRAAPRSRARLVGGRRGCDLEPLAADAVLELVRGALGDHACRGRSRRSGRRAGRPRRGTAWSAARWCPRPRAPRSSPTGRARLRGSRPVVGSSRNSTGGRATSAAARSSRRRMPPE